MSEETKEDKIKKIADFIISNQGQELFEALCIMPPEDLKHLSTLINFVKRNRVQEGKNE